MTQLNTELLNRLKSLTPVNNDLLEKFLVKLNNAQTEAEKNDAVAQLRAKIREIVAEEMQK